VITGADSLCSLFSIFHDGTICHHFTVGSNLELDIYIPYLAHEVAPEHDTFHVSLANVRELRFKTWPNDRAAESNLITSAAQIFAPELDILNCELENSALKVVCTQTSSAWSYSGGELVFEVDAAVVSDQAGKSYSIEELRQLSADYWNNWQKNAGKEPAA